MFVEVFDWAQWVVIVTAIVGFWRHQMKEHEKQIRWRTQTDDRLSGLEAESQRTHDRFEREILHLREMSSEKFNSLDKSIAEIKIMLTSYQNATQTELQTINAALSRIDERTKRNRDQTNG